MSCVVKNDTYKLTSAITGSLSPDKKMIHIVMKTHNSMDEVIGVYEDYSDAVKFRNDRNDFFIISRPLIPSSNEGICMFLVK